LLQCTKGASAINLSASCWWAILALNNRYYFISKWQIKISRHLNEVILLHTAGCVIDGLVVLCF
jgi:hypothetical protein